MLPKSGLVGEGERLRVPRVLVTRSSSSRGVLRREPVTPGVDPVFTESVQTEGSGPVLRDRSTPC